MPLHAAGTRPEPAVSVPIAKTQPRSVDKADPRYLDLRDNLADLLIAERRERGKLAPSNQPDPNGLTDTGVGTTARCP